jgi:hypothetical protein
MRAGCAAFVFLLLLSGGLAALVALRPLRPVDEPPPVPPVVAEPTPPPRPRPEPPPGDYLPRVGAVRRFERSSDGASYRLRYGFIDHHGRSHDVTCRVSRAEHARQVAGFGFSRAEMGAEVDRSLQEMVDEEASRRGLKEFVRVEVRDGGFQARSRLPPMEAAEAERWQDAVRDYWRFLEGPAFARRVTELRDAYLRPRGFELVGDTVRVDYAGLAFRSGRGLLDCFRALEAAGSGYGEKEYLGLFLAFFQELRYEVPPGEDGGRETAGLYVPAEVLVGNHGDCDSKATAFATLWRNFARRQLIIEVPNHALVGVEARPGPGQRHVRVGNRYYVLCEVAGPAKIHPGGRGISGQFSYTLIEPAGEAPPAAERGTGSEESSR